MKKKVLFIVPYPFDKAPSQRLKFEQYYKSIEENGFEIDKSSFISDSFWKIIYKKGFVGQKIYYTCTGYLRRLRDLFRLRQYDVIYLHLWVTPFGPPLFEWLYRKMARKIVYDIDDMIYLTPPNSPNPAINWLKGKGKPIYLFKKSDYVLTSTPAIEEYARKFNDQIINVPITVNTDKYVPKDNYQTGVVTLGWSGSVSTSPYLHLLDNVLLQLRMKYNFKLLVMGDADFKIDGLDVEAIPWKEEYETSTIRRFDIGLYPLPVDNWVHGKGGGKALQYMAAGVPTIATAVGANFKIIEHGVSGFLVKTDEEWLSCIQKLIESEQLRAQVGSRGVRVVENRFSVHANKDIYLSVLRMASGNNR